MHIFIFGPRRIACNLHDGLGPGEPQSWQWHQPRGEQRPAQSPRASARGRLGSDPAARLGRSGAERLLEPHGHASGGGGRRDPLQSPGSRNCRGRDRALPAAVARARRVASAAQGGWATAPREAGERAGCPASSESALRGWDRGSGQRGPARGQGVGCCRAASARPGPGAGGGRRRVAGPDRGGGGSVPRVGPAGTYPRRHSHRQRQQQQRREEEDGEGPVPQQRPQARRGHLCGDTRLGREREQRAPLPP